MKPIIQWVRGWPKGYPPSDSVQGYWACRWRKGFAYKSGVGSTPQRAYEMWAILNGVRP